MADVMIGRFGRPHHVGVLLHQLFGQHARAVPELGLGNREVDEPDLRRGAYRRSYRRS